MRVRPAAGVAILFVMLLALPISGARFTDTTVNEGNLFAFGAAQPIRSTTYRVTFSGAYHTLTLNQSLADNYFVLLRGSADPDGAVDEEGIAVAVDASSDYVRIVGDPTGRPGSATGDDQLRLGRFSDTGTWWGQVTVVESLDRHATAGFTLRGVHRAPVTGDAWSTPGSWVDESQVALYGGSMGGGMAVNGPEHASGWARIWASGGQINVARDDAPDTANFTIYEIEWGSEWTIQSVRVRGSRGGSGVDTPNDYDTASLPLEVARDRAFVLAYGTTEGSAPGTGWEGQIYTLGNGHAVNSKPNRAAKAVKTVAVGSEYPSGRDAQVYVHSHPRLWVDHRFGPHGSIPAGAGSGSATVDAPIVADIHVGASTGTLRFPVLSNSSTGSSSGDPQPIAWSRHTGATRVSWARNDSTHTGAYWLQSIDFGEIWR